MLRKIQNKSPKEKRKLLWILIISSAFIIFIAWLVAFPKDYLEKKEGQKKLSDIQREINESEQSKSFNEYMDSLELYQNFEEGFNFEEFVDTAVEDIKNNNDQNHDSSYSEYYEMPDQPSSREYRRLPLEENDEE